MRVNKIFDTISPMDYDLAFYPEKHGFKLSVPRNLLDKRHEPVIRDLPDQLPQIHFDLTDTLFLAETANVENPIQLMYEMFSAINRFPNYYAETAFSGFESHPDPLVSCVILVTYNSDFVKNQLIPSIIENSRNHAIEIIIVHNGESATADEFPGCRWVDSELLWVARAYNRGVEAAIGKYVAIFHDDCILDDPHWLATAYETISGATVALTSEFIMSTAKCAPLVIQKSDITSFGGFDETFFMGMEDTDFSTNVYCRGLQIKKGIRAMHFNGASTILLFSHQASDYYPFLTFGIIAGDRVKQLAEYYLQRSLEKGFHLHIAKSQLYYFKKHLDSPVMNKMVCEDKIRELTQILEKHPDSPHLDVNSNTIMDLLEN